MGLVLLTIAVLVLFIVQELKYKKLNDEVLGALVPFTVNNSSK